MSVFVYFWWFIFHSPKAEQSDGLCQQEMTLTQEHCFRQAILFTFPRYTKI